MAKLYFKYGAMGSSKSANALMTQYNYGEKGKKSILVKSEVDTRDGNKIIKSRIGLQHECVLLNEFLKEEYHRKILELSKITDESEFKLIQAKIKEECYPYDGIVVDEIQFASVEQIDFLSDIVDFLDIPVMCYGLRCDFRNKFFPGSLRLMEIADSIEEIKTICWCGRKATCNARYNEEGKVVTSGEQVVLGANNKYTSVCRKHLKQGKLFE